MMMGMGYRYRGGITIIALSLLESEWKRTVASFPIQNPT
jgi:hypothetical protein